MKKIFGAFSIALLAFSSCQKNENPSPAEDCTVLTVTLGPSCGTTWQQADIIASNGIVSEQATSVVPSSQKFCSDGADPDCRLYTGSDAVNVYRCSHLTTEYSEF